MSVNKVILLGNLGKDPDIRSMQSGDKVANFSIAMSESWKDKTTGEKKEKTQWHNIAVFNQGAVKFIENNVEKGCKVYVEGVLEHRKWTDSNGTDKYITEVVIKPFDGKIELVAGVKKEKSEEINSDMEDDIPF